MILKAENAAAISHYLLFGRVPYKLSSLRYFIFICRREYVSQGQLIPMNALACYRELLIRFLCHTVIYRRFFAVVVSIDTGFRLSSPFCMLCSATYYATVHMAADETSNR